MPAHSQLRPKVSFVLRVLAVALLLLTGVLAESHPASARPAASVVEVGGIIYSDTTWTSSNIYYIKTNLLVASGARLTIQPGTIVKFFAPYPLVYGLALTVEGTLVLPGPTETPVIFTSGRDDKRGGDTNGDGSQLMEAPGDWYGIVVNSSASPWKDMTGMEVHYADRGLQVVNSSASTPIAPSVHHNLFSNNICGLTLTVQSSGGIGTGTQPAVISNNLFQDNEFGFCTTADGDGLMTPQLASNTFKYNRQLPVYLIGTAYPTYTDNTFIGYDAPNDGHPERHLGIGLGGTIWGSGTWEMIKGYNNMDMPFVVVESLTIASGTTITVKPGTIVKFYTRDEWPSKTKDADLPALTVYGKLDLPPLADPGSPSLQNPAIFTSYHDDINGDTNGDAQNKKAAAGDWYQVYFPDETETDPQLSVVNAEFRYAVNGLYYESNYAKKNISHAPVFSHLRFYGNVNGLRLKTATSATYPNIVLRPVIEYCAFELNGRIPNVKTEIEHGVPIYLENTVQPTYTSNTFTANLHPAIGVAGIWRMSTTWENVPGQGLTRLPYLVHGTVLLGTADKEGKDDTMTLTLPAGAVIKFNVNPNDVKYKSRLVAAGKLNLLSAKGTNPVVFVSIYDDYLQDTSGENTAAKRTDWTDVEVHHPDSKFDNIIVHNALEGLHLLNVGTYQLSPPVTNSTFENNTNGLEMEITSSGDIASPVSDCIFRNNDYGLVTLAGTSSTGISKPVLLRNTFEYHTKYPIYLNGSASPVYSVDPGTGKPNLFQNNAHRGIALGGYYGSADDPIYLPRVPGDVNAPFNGKTFPYVILNNIKFDWRTQTHMDGGLVFKTAKGQMIQFYGSLAMNTSAGSPNYFTADVDDYYDDTDAAVQPTKIARNYWNGIYLYNVNTTSFSYSTMKYAKYGLTVFEAESSTDSDPYIGDFHLTLLNNTFTEDQYGLAFWIESYFDTYATVQNSTFANNDYGLYTFANPKKPHIATIFPDLINNTFTNHAQFPIYWQGTTSPNYHVRETGKQNTFSANIHKAIAVGGRWANNSTTHPPITWTRVPGDDGKYFPYVVLDDITLELIQLLPTPVYTTIILPEQTLIKLDTNKYIYAEGKLEFNSSAGKEIIFTSYQDDTVYFPNDAVNQIGGDTNANGIKTTLPARNSWNSVWLIDFPGKYHVVHNTITKYAVSGFVIFYDGWENANILTEIHDSLFTECHTAISSVVGWWIDAEKNVIGGIGNVNARLTDVTISNSNYGLVTAAHQESTGVNRPTLTRVTFSNIDWYPIFMGGTTEPIFASGNLVIPKAAAPSGIAGAASAPVPPEAMPPMQAPDLSHLAGLQLPEEEDKPDAIQAGLPGDGIMVTGTSGLSPAIAMGGYWNNSVTLPALGNLPYAIVGNFPVHFILGSEEYWPSNDVFVGAKTPPDKDYMTLIVQPGTIFKFADNLQMTFMKASTLSIADVTGTPVVFTSFKDDAAGGDTNGDGAATSAAKGIWKGIKISSKNPAFVFNNALVRYAAEGLHLFYDGEMLTQITIQVTNSRFMYNTVGVTLTADKAGDVQATLTGNQFYQNDTQILGNPAQPGYMGRLRITAHKNDLYGGKPQVGVINNNGNDNACYPQTSSSTCDFDASQNYWGHSSGPYHPTLNAAGQGSTVSDKVKIFNWLTTGTTLPASFTVSGQVTENKVNNPGLGSVTMTLYPLGRTVSTNESGVYEFQNVPAGSYILTASRDGYSFTPRQIFIQNLSSDAAGLDFKSDVILPGLRISVESARFMAFPNTSHTVFVRVMLDKPNDIGANITVNYTFLNGTATGGLTNTPGVDFTYAKPATITFKPGEQVKTIAISLRARPANSLDEFFTIELLNPQKAQIGVGVGKIMIGSGLPLFISELHK